MKKGRSFWFMVMLVGFALLGVSMQSASAAYEKHFVTDRQMMQGQEAAQTAVPSPSRIPEATEIPADRILPPVGSNAYLVLGASILVLIIIWGVMIFSRMRRKH